MTWLITGIYFTAALFTWIYHFTEKIHGGASVLHGLFWPIGLMLMLPVLIKKYLEQLKEMDKP